MMDATQEIKRLCREIVEHFNPQKIILFGSYAHGTPNEDSDIDMLVIMPYQGRESQKAIEIRQKIRTALPLDLLVRTEKEFKKRIEMEDFFMREISEKGKVLDEKDHERVDRKGRRRLESVNERISGSTRSKL